MTKVQKSYVNIAYWACAMQAGTPAQQQQVKRFIYLFIMDLGISPFVKCYDHKTLISATVHSGRIRFLQELLSHRYVVIHANDFESMQKRCASKDIKGNNLLHAICQLPLSRRNEYLEVVHHNPVEIVYRYAP